MEQVKSFNDTVSKNKIFVDAGESILNNSTIQFAGEKNILYVENGVKVYNSVIDFPGNNSVVYLARNKHIYYINVSANTNTCVYIGSNNYMNGRLTLIASEEKNIIIGNDGLFSFGIYLRTADPHLIYDVSTKMRMNMSQSILLGDHVWIGQNAMILKGTTIGSGSVVGSGAIVSGKTISSNVIVAGNPAKVVKENIFFSGECVHAWTSEETQRYMMMDTDRYIYANSSKTINVDWFYQELSKRKLGYDKLIFLQKNLYDEKNRFFQ